MPKIKMVARTPLSASSRLVQLLGEDRVIKFGCPKSAESGGQNVVEGQNWDRVKNHQLAPTNLAEVFAYAKDGSWLIQKRVRGTVPTKKQQQQFGPFLEMMLEDMDINSEDVNPTNWMLVGKDTPVMIDFGYSKAYEGDDGKRCGKCVHCVQTGQR